MIFERFAVLRTSRWIAVLWLATALSAAEPWTMPADQQQAIIALADRAVTLGLPDARGATPIHGSLGIAWDGGEPISINGLHLRLADGGWLVLGCLRLDPRLGVRINETDTTTTMTTTQLVALVQQTGTTIDDGLIPPTPAIAAQWAACGDGIALAALNASWMSAHAAGCSQSWAQNGIAAASMAALIHLGVPGAERGAIGISRLAWSNDGDDHGVIAPLHLGRPWVRKGLVPAAPAEALRRGLIAWFRRQAAGGLPPPFTALPRDQAIAAMRGLLTDADRNELVEVDALQALPPSATANDPLAVRLAGYLAPPLDLAPRFKPLTSQLVNSTIANWDRMTQEQRDKLLATRFPIRDWLLTCRFEAATIDNLLALLGDERPSHWLDRGHPRTIGDQALRLISERLACDPRSLIGRDPFAPWTTAERSAVARELTAWWRANHQRPLTDLLIEALPRLSFTEVVTMTQNQHAGIDQVHLLNQLATWWAGSPPADAAVNALDDFLFAHRAHAAFAAAVDVWPLSEPHHELLAAWHAGRGHPHHLDALVTQALTAAADDPDRSPQVVFLLPTAASLAVLQRMLLDDPGTPRFRSLYQSLEAYDGTSTSKLVRLNDPHAASRALAMRLALSAQLLNDRRPAPAWMRKYHSQRMDVRLLAQSSATKALPGDLRVADLMAIQTNALWATSDHGRNQTPLPDNDRVLHADLAQRDLMISQVLACLIDDLPDRLTACGLPLVIPGMTLPATTGEIMTVPF